MGLLYGLGRYDCSCDDNDPVFQKEKMAIKKEE